MGIGEPVMRLPDFFLVALFVVRETAGWQFGLLPLMRRR